MKTKLTHTPTPWQISETTTNDVSDQTNIWIDDENGRVIFNLPKLGGRDYEQMMANAAFVVRAVNNHDKYERIIDALKDWAKTGHLVSMGMLMPDHDTQTLGEAILDAAKGLDQ